MKILAILLSVLGLAPAVASAERSRDWIIVFASGVRDPDAEASRQAAKHDLVTSKVYKHALKGMAARVPDRRLDAVKRDRNVRYVYPDLPVEPDGFTIETTTTPELYDAGSRRVTHLLPELPLPAPAYACSLGLGAPCYDDLPENRGQGVTIAILDDGVDASHPDLMGPVPIEHHRECAPGEGHDDLGMHGTFVTGSIYMQPNGIGGIGLAPGARIWDVRSFDVAMNKWFPGFQSSGNRGLSGVLCAVEFVVSRAPANVVNDEDAIHVASMSFHVGEEGQMPRSDDCGRTPGAEDPLHEALCRGREAGVIWVAAAGNQHGPVSVIMPAFYDDAVITVSGLAQSSAVHIEGEPEVVATCTDPRFPEFGVLAENTFTTFSNYDADPHHPVIDLAAPACAVATTLPTNHDFYEHWFKFAKAELGGNVFKKNDLSRLQYFAYMFGNGTSIATPMVAAGVALWIAKYRAVYDATPYADRLALVLHGDGRVPGLVDLAEHLAPGTCLDPSEPGCPHYNYRRPAPDNPPGDINVHPEPVLDVSALLDL